MNTKKLSLYFNQHPTAKTVIRFSVGCLAFLTFFALEYLAMSFIQVSVFFTGTARYLSLAGGLVLALFFTYYALRYIAPQSFQLTKDKWKQSLSLKKVKWLGVTDTVFVFSVYIIAFAALSVWSLVQIDFLAKWSPDTTENQAAIDQLMNMGGRYSLVFMSIMIMFIGPVLEELLFRGVFFKTFKKRTTGYWTVFFSGLLFGLYHLGSYTWVSLLDLPPYLILGIALAYVYNKTGKLTAPMMLHIFHNTWVQALMIYTLLK